MTNYVTKELHNFQHPNPRRTQYAPHQWTRPNSCATKQLANPLDTSPPIPEERKRRIQQMVGTFLYFYRAVDCTMIPALNTIADQHSNPTQKAEAAITQFIDHADTNPSMIVQYKSSDMILHIDSDAA